VQHGVIDTTFELIVRYIKSYLNVGIVENSHYVDFKIILVVGIIFLHIIHRTWKREDQTFLESFKCYTIFLYNTILWIY